MGDLSQDFVDPVFSSYFSNTISCSGPQRETQSKINRNRPSCSAERGKGPGV